MSYHIFVMQYIMNGDNLLGLECGSDIEISDGKVGTCMPWIDLNIVCEHEECSHDRPSMTCKDWYLATMTIGKVFTAAYWIVGPTCFRCVIRQVGSMEA